MKKRKPADLDRQLCPVVNAVKLIGDKWTLLILREMYLGFRKFDDFQKNLTISKSVLTVKLNRMLELGLLEKKEYQVEKQRSRYEYCLTDKGIDSSKVIIALLEWGNSYLVNPKNPSITTVEKGTFSATRLCMNNEQGEVVDWKDLRLVIQEK